MKARPHIVAVERPCQASGDKARVHLSGGTDEDIRVPRRTRVETADRLCLAIGLADLKPGLASLRQFRIQSEGFLRAETVL